MRQAKLVLATLPLLLSLSVSYAAVDNDDSDNINYNSPQYNSSLQEDNTSDSEKEDNSVSNVLRDYGPITICSDRATYDSEKGTLTYYDNVFAMQIHNKHILCHKPTILKPNAVYFDRDKNSSLKQLQQKWYEHAKKLCADEKECNFISGEKLTMQLTKDKKVKTLTMESSGNQESQFYTFPTNPKADYLQSKKLTRGPVNGVAKKIIYNVAKKDLELYQEAVVVQNENQYKGEKVVYDLEHDLISIPGSRNKRSTIVLDGIQKQTKVTTGLTPIKDYGKKPRK